MTASRPRLVQAAWLTIAAAFLTLAVLMRSPLDRMSQTYGLVSKDNRVMANHPEYSFYQMLPGAFRSLLNTFLWIRHDQLKEAGQYHEAVQLAEMRCRLQPRNPYTWEFCSWDLAWNISVTAQTPQERYRWVTQGIRLLRDEALEYNPRSLVIYRQIGWIFATKMAGNTDDMHMYYKRRWASEMQHLLAAPPMSETSEVIKAFAPVAEAPIDKTPEKQGKEDIQSKCLRWLTDPNCVVEGAGGNPWYDPQVAKYVDRLKDAGIGAGYDLLEAYNRFSRDDAAEIVRIVPAGATNGRESKASEVINDPQFVAARGKLLAFVRAQLLWNKYRMDPVWMLELMKTYGPIDWRLTSSHGLYWVTMGLHVAQDVSPTNVDTLNTDRTVQNCLKDLTWNGRLRYLENPDDPNAPNIVQWADWRFMITTLNDFKKWIKLVVEAEKGHFDENTFRAGHINYVLAVIQMLYIMDRPKEAQGLLDELRKEYHLSGPEWDRDLKDIVDDRIHREMRQGSPPTPELASQQITAALATYFARQSAGDKKGSQWYLNYARDFHRQWQVNAVKRLRQEIPEGEILDAFNYYWKANILAEFLVHPGVHGYKIDLVTRSVLYGDQTIETRQVMYDMIAPFLKEQCRVEGLDFNKAFPEPRDMQEYRQRRRGTVSIPSE
jgi:hypothetical protein